VKIAYSFHINLKFQSELLSKKFGVICYCSTLTERMQQEFLLFKFPGSRIATSKCHWVVFAVCYSVTFLRSGFVLMTGHLIPASHLSTELTNICIYHNHI